MALSAKQDKINLDCWSAMDKIADCAARMLRGTKSTPGFCSQNIEERLQAHHAPMDFSHGTGGRIISDPQEAALVAKTSIRLRTFPSSQTSSIVTGAGAGQEDPSMDLSTPPCSQLWFRPGMAREQANTALFPHRHRDGVFLIRSCSRQANNYVLSFTSNNKIVHAQIVRVSHTGKNAFSLDGAKTKFPSLEHLVDFHKMNSGPLPTILQDAVLDSSPDTAHCGRELEHRCSS